MAAEADGVQVDVDGAPVGDWIDKFIEAEADGDAEAEVQPKLKIRTPDAPTASELAEHRDGGHAPYRPWCDECVEAFGREDGHFDHGRIGERRIPVVSIDYLFLTPKGVFTRPELQERYPEFYAKIDVDDDDEVLKILVLYDSFSKAVFAHAIRRKGAEPYVVQCVVDNISWIGHVRLTLKSDNEPAILALVTEALRGLRVQMDELQSISAEGSVPYDPQTNGAAEAAVKNVKQSVRANLLTLEKRLGTTIPTNHAAVTWLVRHSAMLRTIRVRGRDGRTAFERVRGTECTSKLLGFGELCRYKCRSHEGRIAGTDSRFSVGVWLGVDLRSGQYILWDPKLAGLRNSRTLLRLPDVAKFDREKVADITITPWTEFHEPEPRVRFPEVPKPPDAVRDELRQVRRAYIRQSDLGKYGYTEGCPKCEHIIQFGPDRCTVNHSEACRTRISDKLAETPEGRARLGIAEERAGRYFEAVRQRDTPAAQPQGEIAQDDDDERRPVARSSSVGAPSSFDPLPPAASSGSPGSPGSLFGPDSSDGMEAETDLVDIELFAAFSGRGRPVDSARVAKRCVRGGVIASGSGSDRAGRLPSGGGRPYW